VRDRNVVVSHTVARNRLQPRCSIDDRRRQTRVADRDYIRVWRMRQEVGFGEVRHHRVGDVRPAIEERQRLRMDGLNDEDFLLHVRASSGSFLRWRRPAGKAGGWEPALPAASLRDQFRAW